MKTEEIRILVAIPTRSHPTVEAFSAAQTAVATVKGLIDARLTWSACEPVERNRNAIVTQFLEAEENYTHLLFIDDDVIVPEYTISRLLGIDKDVVSVPTPMHLNGKTWSNCAYQRIPGVESDPENPAKAFTWSEWWAWPPQKEPLQIGSTGMGAVLIRREVFETLKWPWFVMDWGDQYGKGNVSEDVYFCNQCTAAGIDLWCDPSLEAGHLKRIDLAGFVPLEAASRMGKAVTKTKQAG